MVVSYFKLFLHIQKNNLKVAFVSKLDAFMNIFFMLANNLAFTFMWWVLFSMKGIINGWKLEHILLMHAFNNFGFSFFALFARGVEKLPEYIENGSLDSYITTPRNSLFMIATSESTFANWGDLITAIVLLIFSGFTSPSEIALFIFLGLICAITFIAFRLLLSSLSFFKENLDRFGNNMYMSFLIFSSQPGSVFLGWYKFIYLTIIPAGFVSLVPVEILSNFSWKWLGLMIIFNICLCLIAYFTFCQGLKKYSSGNKFGLR